ncbi:MAG: SPASM domain-containing protein [Candidatus Gastranaerophilales bacterium]|nr:SPASM domain-containing protein [Candidatus Gastranaerophilales bacterium]
MNNTQNEKYCFAPFYMAEISSTGDVYPCCPQYINFYSFGNIFHEDFEKIWNSKKAEFFRNKILNSDYSLCNKEICVFNIQKTKEEIFSYNTKKTPPVKFLRFAYDITCNIACKTCRSEIYTDRNLELDKMYDRLSSILDSVETVQLSTSGDVFASKHGRNILSKICKNHPNIKLHIDTNGILLTPNLYKELQLKNKIEKLIISIPALKESTYNRIIKYGNYKKLYENFDFLIEERNKGHISQLDIVMVIHKLNYKEMISMAKIAIEKDINIFYTAYQPWKNSPFATDYNELAIFNKKHKEHKKFLKIINNPIFKMNNCSFEPQILKLLENTEKQNNLLDIIHKFFNKTN